MASQAKVRILRRVIYRCVRPSCPSPGNHPFSNTSVIVQPVTVARIFRRLYSRLDIGRAICVSNRRSNGLRRIREEFLCRLDLPAQSGATKLITHSSSYATQQKTIFDSSSWTIMSPRLIGSQDPLPDHLTGCTKV